LKLWSRPALTSLLLPGGLLLLAALVLSRATSVQLPVTLVEFCYIAAFGGGLLLAWRFHSTRTFFALVSLVLAERALNFYVPTRVRDCAMDSVAILLALNFVALAFMEERGFTGPALATRLIALLVEASTVAMACSADQGAVARALRTRFFHAPSFQPVAVSQLAFFLTVTALVILGLRSLVRRKPVDSGFFWALFAFYFALRSGGAGKMPMLLFGAACLILLTSIVETSYLMAYHDELTGLPGRRAFNQAILGLQQRYAIAIVDVDHFKQFNDRYGHDIGDQVLRLVAGRLGQVTGGGKAFRCGGEEFAIVFAEKSALDVLQDLELLRELIETSRFKVRSAKDRRSVPRGTDRRKSTTKKLKLMAARSIAPAAQREVRVTVSIGVAEPTTSDRDVDQVIRTADKALYRAKENGRNRVEVGPAPANKKRRRAAQGKS
jgi:diguanylate cyclase (GGDEF)-like protein